MHKTRWAISWAIHPVQTRLLVSKRIYTTLPTQNTLLRLDVSKSGDFGEKQVVRAAGVEPTTSGFGGQRSIQLSYARIMLIISGLGD